MLRVAAFTPGRDISSSRFRVRQYVKPLADLDVRLDEFTAFLGSYPPEQKGLRPLWAFGTLLTRLPGVLASHGYDVTLLQREMLSTLTTLEPFTGAPRVLDLDDAVWFQRRGAAIVRLAQSCDAVICGNEFLAEWAVKQNRRVSIVPTAVDSDHYRPGGGPNNKSGVVIGWMGQSVGYQYLNEVGNAIGKVLDAHPNVRFQIVSDAPPRERAFERERVEFVRWSAKSELTVLQSFDIGIMPLASSEWCRGKCSYKMLLYMSCGVPVVVSNFGMNSEVLKKGPVGYGAQTEAEWVDGLASLIRDQSLRVQMGMEGRDVIEKFYSLRILAPRFASLLKQYAS